MKFYLFGVFVASIIAVINLIIMGFKATSTKSKNLRKVGLYIDPSTGGYSEEKLSVLQIVFLIVDMIIITPLFSWLTVGYTIFTHIKIVVTKEAIPEPIKELNYKLSTLDLSKEKVIEYLNNTSLFFGFKPNESQLRVLDEYDSDIFVLDDG